MKILLTANKTYRGAPDSICWYFWEPLIKLGHEVHFYDTVAGDPDNTFTQIIESFRPDLIFSIMTGNTSITPHEPWQLIADETSSGRTRTFNWFCDDTWRFDNFSKIACNAFLACSTPERSYVQKYKDIGYQNILVANWHANSTHYPKISFEDKDIDISFIGAPNKTRKDFFERASVDVEFFFGINQEQLFETFSKSKVSVNLSINNNDPQKKTQMKQRIFEIPAGGGLLMTEYHEGIEEYFEINKEIFTFKTHVEFKEKMNFLSKHPALVKKVATAGHKRFLKEHDSEIRLSKVLESIMSI